MAIAYVPPGVSVDEITSPNVSPLLAAGTSVCLVGRSDGFRSATVQFRITDVSGDPVAIPIPGLASTDSLLSVVSVTNALDEAQSYLFTDDYTVDLDDKTITRVDSSDLDDDTIVNVIYTYLPDNYFEATRFDDFSAIEYQYGPAYSDDGTTINSTLSYAASLAFENGASTIVCQPLFQRTTADDPASVSKQPVDDAAFANATTWANTLYALRDIEDINVIVPVVGQSDPSVNDAAQQSIFKAVQDHIQNMRANDQYIVAVLGEDSSTDSTVATEATLLSHAAELATRAGGLLNQHIAFIEPSRFGRISPKTGRKVVLGGQYAAAAFAGMMAARPVSAPLTRKQVSGLSEVLVPRLKNEKNVMAQAGFTVLEQRGSAVIVRHALTLDPTSTASRELTIVRAKHRMIESVRDTIDTQIIGQIIADDAAPLVVRGAIIAVLERLLGDGDLVGYRNVDARTLSLDPTTIEVRFSYRPAFPVNYVNIKFSLDLTGDNGLVVGQ